MFRDDERIFRIGERMFSNGKHKIYRGLSIYYMPGREHFPQGCQASGEPAGGKKAETMTPAADRKVYKQSGIIADHCCDDA